MQFKKITLLLFVVLLAISCGAKKPVVKTVAKPRTVVAKKPTTSVNPKTTTPTTPTTLLDNARMVLEKYDFDCIVYPDLGMKLLPTLLAYSRIALTQITTWGHSETSGIDTIDYFISSEYFENMISTSSHLPQDNYTEKLILFKSLGTFYISPHKLFIENNQKYEYARHQ